MTGPENQGNWRTQWAIALYLITRQLNQRYSVSIALFDWAESGKVANTVGYIALHHTTAEPWMQTPSTGLRHPSFGGRCRKAALGVCHGWCRVVYGNKSSRAGDHDVRGRKMPTPETTSHSAVIHNVSRRPRQA